MKILRVHAPGTHAGLADGLGQAVARFNRGLDIRLRFLAVGIEETVLTVADAVEATEQVGEAVRTGAPELTLLLGEGDTALAAAAAVVRAGGRLVRVGAGAREGAVADAARAIDRIAAVLLVHGDAARGNLEAEGLSGPVGSGAVGSGAVGSAAVGSGPIDVGAADDPETGARIVRGLSRARRAGRGGG